MPGPFTCTDLLVQVGVTLATVGVVTGLDITLSYEDGVVQHVYGSKTGRIAHGGRRGTFRLQRWFKTDTDTDILFDLFDGRIPFYLTGAISGVANSTVSLSNCMANSWRLITGDPNTKVGEEISGECTDWSATDIAD